MTLLQPATCLAFLGQAPALWTSSIVWTPWHLEWASARLMLGCPAILVGLSCWIRLLESPVHLPAEPALVFQAPSP